MLVLKSKSGYFGWKWLEIEETWEANVTFLFSRFLIFTSLYPTPSFGKLFRKISSNSPFFKGISVTILPSTPGEFYYELVLCLSSNSNFSKYSLDFYLETFKPFKFWFSALTILYTLQHKNIIRPMAKIEVMVTPISVPSSKVYAFSIFCFLSASFFATFWLNSVFFLSFSSFSYYFYFYSSSRFFVGSLLAPLGHPKLCETVFPKYSPPVPHNIDKIHPVISLESLGIFHTPHDSYGFGQF